MAAVELECVAGGANTAKFNFWLNLLNLGLNVEKDQQTEILQQMLVEEAMHRSPLMLQRCRCCRQVCL